MADAIHFTGMAELPTGTVTFLFTDIEGSTRLLDELGADAYADALASHRRVLRHAFAANGGVEVDTQGDAFFVAFPTARGALAAAAQAQSELTVGPIRVRMGIHSGEPLLTDEGYVGIDVHRGARVMSAGYGGQVLVSHATYALLDGDSGLIDLGRHRLKDLTEPQPLYQLGEGEFPSLKTLNQTNLPVQPTPLVGREAELGELLGLLGESRLVTLTGAGGSGKTRLALQAAAELVDEYEDGVWWVSLAALRDAELVEPTIAQVVGAKNDLAEHLRAKKTLLLLDNLEQLLEAAPRIAELLADAPELHVLATSRERLTLSAEQEYPVPTLVPAEAVALFTARARRLKPRFDPDEDVEEICRRLDGLPLALELAAARIKVLTSAQILQRLGHSLDLLTTGARDAPERQRSLRATIAWSYDLLSAAEQQLLRSLSVFVDGWTLEAAEDVCHADLEVLQSLIEKSLIRFAEGRYWMLETIRDYARERAIEHGETEPEHRHAEYFLALAEEAESDSSGLQASGAKTQLAGEHNNLRAARKQFRHEGDGEREMRLATAVWPFLMRRGYLSEGRIWLEEGLSNLDGQPSEQRAEALFGAAILAVWQGDYARGRAFAEESLGVARSLGGARGVARALDALALAVQGEGQYAEAAALFEECRTLSRATGDDWLLSIATNNLGDLALNEGKYDRATALFEESLTLGRKRGDPDRIARSLVNLATAHIEEGRDEIALALLQEGLDHAAQAELVEVVGLGLEAAAAIAATRGDAERAVTLLGKAEALRNEIGAAQHRFEKGRNEQTLATAGKELSPDALSAATSAGMNMPLEEALSLALGYE